VLVCCALQWPNPFHFKSCGNQYIDSTRDQVVDKLVFPVFYSYFIGTVGRFSHQFLVEIIYIYIYINIVVLVFNYLLLIIYIDIALMCECVIYKTLLPVKSTRAQVNLTGKADDGANNYLCHFNPRVTWISCDH